MVWPFSLLATMAQSPITGLQPIATFPVRNDVLICADCVLLWTRCQPLQHSQRHRSLIAFKDLWRRAQTSSRISDWILCEEFSTDPFAVDFTPESWTTVFWERLHFAVGQLADISLKGCLSAWPRGTMNLVDKVLGIGPQPGMEAQLRGENLDEKWDGDFTAWICQVQFGSSMADTAERNSQAARGGVQPWRIGLQASWDGKGSGYRCRSPADYLFGLNKLLNALESINGRTQLDKRGKVRQQFYVDLRRKAGERISEFSTRLRILVADLKSGRLFKDLHESDPPFSQSSSRWFQAQADSATYVWFQQVWGIFKYSIHGFEQIHAELYWVLLEETFVLCSLFSQLSKGPCDWGWTRAWSRSRRSL